MEETNVRDYFITGERIADKDKENGLYYYELRHDHEGNITTIENYVKVNFAGTLVTNFEVLNGNDYLNYNGFLKQMNVTEYNLMLKT